MATTPSTHSRNSSNSSSRSSSPCHQFLPRNPQFPHHRHLSPSHNHVQQQPQRQPNPIQSTQPSCSTNSQQDPQQTRTPHHRGHTRGAPPITSLSSIQPPHPNTNTRRTTDAHLTTSIERATLPMLAHLTQQLSLTHLEPERDRVRRQLHRQETVLTLSMLLKMWGDQGIGEGECSCWSDDSDDESGADDEEWEY
jgi:hypothetical protein